MHACLCTYECMHVFMYLLTYTYTDIHIHIHTHMYYLYIYRYSYRYRFRFRYMHTHIYTYIYMRMYVYINMYICFYLYPYLGSSFERPGGLRRVSVVILAGQAPVVRTRRGHGVQSLWLRAACSVSSILRIWKRVPLPKP